MPKTAKSRIIFLANYLLKNTDSNHSIDIQSICNALEEEYEEKFNIKTIYDDINVLQDQCGMDIIKGNGLYRVNSRKFSFNELQMLIDLVQSSKFISPGKSRELIDKLKGLTSKYEGGRLQRSVDIINRIKSHDESVLDSVGVLASAIENKSMVKFHYYKYDEQGNLVRKQRAKYDVTPFFLMIDNENYYLRGWDNVKNRQGTYRVDKMSNVKQIEGKRDEKLQKMCEEIPKGKLSTMLFGMFDGEHKRVKIRFPISLIGAAYDILGRDNMFVMPDGPDYILVESEVVVSDHFFGWLLGLGKGTEIVGPPEIRDEMREALKKNLQLYDKEML